MHKIGISIGRENPCMPVSFKGLRTEVLESGLYWIIMPLVFVSFDAFSLNDEIVDFKSKLSASFTVTLYASINVGGSSSPFFYCSIISNILFLSFPESSSAN